ncbi:hypothetical protein EYR41_003063 [Orbilia oligospora]|uniref:Uncharacterized protein n=1 Tax=Orbilia oligospora TaxID=2813651 RepID=A0A8H2E1Y4_ORBOL|nr:hypothetical protein EYR41_003063 [Orbilia oligospora]
MNGFIIGILAPWLERSTPSIFVPFLIGNKTRRFFKNERHSIHIFKYLLSIMIFGESWRKQFWIFYDVTSRSWASTPIIEPPTSSFSNMFDGGECVESRLS